MTDELLIVSAIYAIDLTTVTRSLHRRNTVLLFWISNCFILQPIYYSNCHVVLLPLILWSTAQETGHTGSQAKATGNSLPSYQSSLWIRTESWYREGIEKGSFGNTKVSYSVRCKIWCVPCLATSYFSAKHFTMCKQIKKGSLLLRPPEFSLMPPHC